MNLKYNKEDEFDEIKEELNNITNKDELIVWLHTQLIRADETIQEEFSTSEIYDEIYEVERELISQKVNEIMNGSKPEPMFQINKKVLLQTIIESYLDINDEEHTPKHQDDYDVPNTEKENHIMRDIWSEFIDHLFVPDMTLFSHIYVIDDKVYAHFADAPLDTDIELTSYLTKNDLNRLRIELVEKLK